MKLKEAIRFSYPTHNFYTDRNRRMTIAPKVTGKCEKCGKTEELKTIINRADDKVRVCPECLEKSRKDSNYLLNIH